MKLLCIQDTEEVGLFRKNIQKIEGLTKDKIYDGLLYSNTTGGVHIIATTTKPEFLIFNDLEEWELYPVELFRPENK